MRHVVLPGLTCGVLLAHLAFAQPAGREADVALEVVKQKGYLQALEGLRGKVVLVDVWADFCVPCKELFPHYVEMHEKYASKGLACLSVSVDAAEDKDLPLKFLKRQNATFTNVLLDEAPKTWQEMFDIFGPPAVLVFDRGGKLAQRFDRNDPNKQPYTHDDIEKAVLKLLAK